MATGFEFFERDLRIATAGLEPEEINRTVAAFAKSEVRRVIAEGLAAPTYVRFVNAVEGAAEDSYRAPGAIVYEFTNWALVVNAALAELQKRSPRKSGRFASSFIVIAGGRSVVADFTKIRSDAEIIITNFQPYVRKAEVGMLGVAERYLFAGTARVMANRFRGAFTFTSKFLDVPAGIHSGMPYRLKGHGSNDRISRKSGVLSYPSIIINPVN
ncbi:hypothetical protein [Mesorhizobium sp.]|uniref:hypothetical protein n=1 Tax=Mesorhizobium sp. TaxID=1871066 RepID=UPI000FE67096|nr:hypothetical protein [Mesorhizobium sp.]RWC28813.1 MAG: hypothetical protein EOS27_17890 [Mesorhizobium sp.]TIX28276.1 MAG: hypothetical protein E5V35_02755 [Mesorhizobium sp.]